MTDAEIAGYLASQSVGVLGLPAEDAPGMRPMSFGFDGGSRLYFRYVLGTESREAELSERAGVARVLVYSAETPFNWRSVLLTGTLSEVPEDRRTRYRGRGPARRVATRRVRARERGGGDQSRPVRRRGANGRQTPGTPAGVRDLV